MKTIKWFILIVYIAVGMSSCFQEDQPSSFTQKGVIWATPFEATVYLHDHTVNIIPDQLSPITKTIMNGSGKSKSLGLSDFIYSNSCESFLNSDNNIQLNYGEFQISGNDLDTIKGTYQGWGTLINNELNADLVMKVTSGTGHYRNASGNMNAKIKPNPEYPKEWIMDFSGIIIHEPDTAYP